MIKNKQNENYKCQKKRFKLYTKIKQTLNFSHNRQEKKISTNSTKKLLDKNVLINHNKYRYYKIKYITYTFILIFINYSENIKRIRKFKYSDKCEINK